MGLDLVAGRAAQAAGTAGLRNAAAATADVQAAAGDDMSAQADNNAGLHMVAAIAAAQAVVQRGNLVEA